MSITITSVHLIQPVFLTIFWRPIIRMATVLMHPLHIHNRNCFKYKYSNWLRLYKLTFPLVGYSYRYSVWSSMSIFWDLVNGCSERSTATYFVCSSEFAFDDSVVAGWRTAVEVRPSNDCIRYIVLLILWFLLVRRTTVTIDKQNL